MFRKFIAVITAFVISFVVFVEPVQAEVISINFFNQNNNNLIDHHLASNHYNIWSDPFVKNLINETKQTAGTIVGGAVGSYVACYVLDGAATIAFPPAAALAPFCEAIGVVGRGSAILKGVKPAKYLLRNAL